MFMAPNGRAKRRMATKSRALEDKGGYEAYSGCKMKGDEVYMVFGLGCGIGMWPGGQASR